jgi:hypothetical protein
MLPLAFQASRQASKLPIVLSPPTHAGEIKHDGLLPFEKRDRHPQVCGSFSTLPLLEVEGVAHWAGYIQQSP